MKKLFIVLTAVLLVAGVVYAADQWTLDSNHDGTAEFSITTEGITTVSGMAISGNMGSFPTSGYSEGAIFYNTNSNKVYVATATVTASSCWVVIGEQ